MKINKNILLVTVVGLIFVGLFLRFFIAGTSAPSQETMDKRLERDESLAKVESEAKASSEALEAKGKDIEARRESLAKDIAEQKDESKKAKEEAESSVDKQHDELNKQLAKDLQLETGWLLGKYDSDGKETDNGTPDLDYEWTKYVSKIEVSDKDSIRAYMYENFKNISKEEKDEVAHRIQLFAVGSAMTINSSLIDVNSKPFLELRDQGNKSIGKSSVLDLEKVKWK